MRTQREIWRPILNKEKYKQVILFLLQSSANNVYLGKVKLFKLLYYIDFNHFEVYKASVTGDVYRKLDFGPVPITANQILSEMRQDGLISFGTRSTGSYTQYVFEAVVEPDNNVFSRSEMEVLEQVVQKWANHTRAEIISATHGEAPWRAVEMGEEIPYTLAFYRHKMAGEQIDGDEEPEELMRTG